MGIPFPLGNSPGSCRGIFNFFTLSPTIISEIVQGNCYINISSGHLYPPLCGEVGGQKDTRTLANSLYAVVKVLHLLRRIPHKKDAECLSKKSKYVTQFSCSLAIFSSHFRIWGSFFQQEHIRVLFLRCLPCCESHLSVTLSRWLSLHTFKTTLLANNFSKGGK